MRLNEFCRSNHIEIRNSWSDAVWVYSWFLACNAVVDRSGLVSCRNDQQALDLTKKRITESLLAVKKLVEESLTTLGTVDRL